MFAPFPRNFRYNFLHIPRTAGTTFTYHLEQNFEKDEIIAAYAPTFFNPVTRCYETQAMDTEAR